MAHFNGRAWSATSVASLLPRGTPGGLNDPAVMAMYAQSPTSVWAVGNGNEKIRAAPWSSSTSTGAPGAGSRRTDVAGTAYIGQVAPDGRGGLWIPVPAAEGGASHLVRYSGGRLTAAVLPAGREPDRRAWRWPGSPAPSRPWPGADPPAPRNSAGTRTTWR